MNDILSKELRLTLQRSYREAKKRQHEFITLEHLLYALTFDKTACNVLLHSGANIQKLGKRLKKFIDKDLNSIQGNEECEPQYTIGFQRVIQIAVAHNQSSHSGKQVNGSNIIAAIFREEESHSVYFLQEEGVSRLNVVRYLSHGVSQIDPTNPEDFDQTKSETIQKEVKPGIAVLERFCVNLNKKVKAGKVDLLIGREHEIERTIHVLARRRKNNPIFVGDAGVGKTAIAEGLAAKIIAGKTPAILRNYEIYSLDMGSLLSGTRYRGEFEERLKAVMEALKKKPQAVLFIDEIHTIIGAGAVSGGALDASNILKPALTNGELSCIGTTTYKEYRSIFEKDHALSRRFQKIEVKEPSIEEAIQILQGLQKHYEEYHGVHYTTGAVRNAVELSARYINDRFLPDKAIDILDEVGAVVKLRKTATTEPSNKEEQVKSKQSQTKQKILPKIPYIKIGSKDVEALVARIAQIPSQTIKASDKKTLASLEPDLKKTIYGQEEAITKIVQSIQLSRSGLQEEDKPVGSFLFCGPTGVGKTELSKQLAKHLGIPFIRFDMSEYMEKHTVSRLIGSPPGYVGFEQGGQLTEAIVRKPHCVLLLDEIEKAHEDLFHILLQVMDHATLTDNNGRKADFRNTILIMTTNTGAQDALQNTIGFGPDVHTDRSLKAIEKTFSPEFRNRLSAIIQFNRLSLEKLKPIVDRMIAELSQRLQTKKVKIELSQRALLYLCKKGFDPLYGARPIQRLIDKEISHILSTEILFGRLSQGNHMKTVKIEERDKKLVFVYP